MASKVRYKLDLVQIFNRAYGGKPISLQNVLRPLISDMRVKMAIGMAAIDQIETNTLDGKDKNGKPWRGEAARYTKGYRDSLAFMVYGKSSGPVNLKLSGEMLASMKPVPLQRPTINIEFIDSLNNDKAHGHINGYQNRNPKKKRDFFGLPKDQEEKIMRDVFKTVNREEFYPELGAALKQEIRGQNITLALDEFEE